MASLVLRQHYYSRVLFGLASDARQQTVAQSADLGDVSDYTDVVGYRRPSDNVDVPPVNWGWFRRADCIPEVVIHRIGYSGLDYAGRPGNFLAHSVFINQDELNSIDHDVPCLIRWIKEEGNGFVTHHDQIYELYGKDRNKLSSVEPLQASNKEIEDIREDFDHRLKSLDLLSEVQTVLGPRFPDLLQAYFCKPNERRPILVYGPGNTDDQSETELRIIEFLFSLIPYHCRRDLTFSTYIADDRSLPQATNQSPYRDRRLVMTTKHNKIALSQIESLFWIIDCNSEEEYPLPNQSKMARRYIDKLLPEKSQKPENSHSLLQANITFLIEARNLARHLNSPTSPDLRGLSCCWSVLDYLQSEEVAKLENYDDFAYIVDHRRKDLDATELINIGRRLIFDLDDKRESIDRILPAISKIYITLLKAHGHADSEDASCLKQLICQGFRLEHWKTCQYLLTVVARSTEIQCIADQVIQEFRRCVKQSIGLTNAKAIKTFWIRLRRNTSLLGTKPLQLIAGDLIVIICKMHDNNPSIQDLEILSKVHSQILADLRDNDRHYWLANQSKHLKYLIQHLGLIVGHWFQTREECHKEHLYLVPILRSAYDICLSTEGYVVEHFMKVLESAALWCTNKYDMRQDTERVLEFSSIFLKCLEKIDITVDEADWYNEWIIRFLEYPDDNTTVLPIIVAAFLLNYPNPTSKHVQLYLEFCVNDDEWKSAASFMNVRFHETTNQQEVARQLFAEDSFTCKLLKLKKLLLSTISTLCSKQGLQGFELLLVLTSPEITPSVKEEAAKRFRDILNDALHEELQRANKRGSSTEVKNQLWIRLNSTFVFLPVEVIDEIFPRIYKCAFKTAKYETDTFSPSNKQDKLWGRIFSRIRRICSWSKQSSNDPSKEIIRQKVTKLFSNKELDRLPRIFIIAMASLLSDKLASRDPKSPPLLTKPIYEFIDDVAEALSTTISRNDLEPEFYCELADHVSLEVRVLLASILHEPNQRLADIYNKLSQSLDNRYETLGHILAIHVTRNGTTVNKIEQESKQLLCRQFIKGLFAIYPSAYDRSTVCQAFSRELSESNIKPVKSIKRFLGKYIKI